ncbi:hypothetical protein [Sphingomonas sp.]
MKTPRHFDDRMALKVLDHHLAAPPPKTDLATALAMIGDGAGP